MNSCGPAGAEVREQGRVQPFVCVVVWCACALWLPLGVSNVVVYCRHDSQCACQMVLVLCCNVARFVPGATLDASRSLLNQVWADAVQDLLC